MTRWLASLCLQRVLLPLGLLSASVLRQNGLSAIYLLLLLYNPVVPVPTSKTMGGHTGYYQKVVIFFTTLNIIAAFAFQIVLIAHPPYGSLVTPDCGFLERVFRFSGFVRLDGIDVWSAIRVVAPEVAMLVISIAVYASCLALNHPVSNRQDDPLLPMTDPPPPKPSPSEEAMRQRRLSLLTVLGKYVCLISMCFAGILRPSALSGVYYIVFLGSMTWWGCNRPLHKAFAFICRFLLVLVAGHIWALYLYQMQWAQELLPKDAPIARYLGLTALATTKCDDPRNCHLTDEEWASFVNPVALVWLYFILWYEANMIMSAPDENVKTEAVGMRRQLSVRLSQRGKLLRNQTNRWRSATRKVRAPCVEIEEQTIESPTALTETTPLIRGRESVYRRGTNSKRPIQDSIGVTTLSEVPEDSSQFENVAEEEEDAAPGILEIFVNASMTIAQLLTQSSYIGTIIIMMAWSITYHSWLTFVLLLWASIMWLMPNQRRAMLRSSPFLVLYAELLLLAQYIYGMNLTDEELPQTVQGLNLKQIGLEKITHLPVKPLLIKTLYTVMFWITLKQYNQEKWEARNQSTITGIAAPLQIGVGTATTVAGVEAQTKTNQLIQGIGHTVRSLMTKFWIWVVASILFAIGITGERITIFRIVYMALALIFILTFQLSWTIWRKMMYSFWLIVIIYSMLILVMMYTYQFDNFQTYWETYLHIPPTLQLDIGLERFETTQLFVGLLTPTFFVVITVIQLYYFHKDFLAISDIKSRGTSSVRPRVSEGSSGGVRSDSGEGDITSDLDRNDRLIHPKHSFHILQTFSNLRMHLGVMKIQEILGQAVELVWLFLELHMLKVIMLTIILLAIYDVCAMHLIFVLLAVISTTFGTNIQTMAVHATSVLVSILLLAKMIYQIQYIDHDHWNVTCPSDNTTYNSAEWIGFNKADADHSLPHLVKGYIGVILVVTLHSVVLMRQKYQRHLKGRSLARPLVMFPRVSYRELDKDITHCIKYLFNYGFYRFGVEISLMAVVALIGTRMDFYAVLYSFWLCILIIPKRAFLSKVWGVFTVFIVITIPVQYVLVVGLPPSLCITYPWEDSETMQRFQEWMFFPDPVHPPHAYKLLCDFIVLLFVCRQGVVFRIESRNGDTEYPGGTNKSITQEAEQPDFRNPTPDFISHIRSWLDVVKRVVLSAFIWVTLAIVFLAGTNRVNLFSLGYLIGAFIFLWQGNDFYLRPINVILRWWNYLISYNVVVILLKAMLQILGCIFIKDMKEHACWAVQLLGIACIKKFSDTTAARGVLDPIECSVPRGDVGLAWDGFCFGFLILQRRLFNSYYFFHIIDEAKAMAILASRGAELIEELSHKQILEQQEAERKILEKIKYKMDRIKASQQKVQVASYKEPSSHYVESSIGGVTAPLARQSIPSISTPTGSPQGFHTPVEDDPRHVQRTGSLLQAPSPTSAVLSRSLDCYLEPHRIISFGSPAASFDDSFPVFSPPPHYGSVLRRRLPPPLHAPPPPPPPPPQCPDPPHYYQPIGAAGHRIGPPWMGPLSTPQRGGAGSVRRRRRPTTSRAAIRSGDYYMFDDLDEELDLIYEHQADSAEDDTDDATSRPDVFKLLSSVLKTDIGQATAMAEESGERRSRSRSRSRSSAGETRRSSLPVIPRPSSVGSSVETAHRPPLDASQDLWRSCSSLPDSPEIESKPGPSGSRKKDDGSKRGDGSDIYGDEDRTQLVGLKFHDVPDGFSPDGGDSKRDKPESISGEEEEEEEKDQSLASKIMTVLKFLWAFINSVMVTITKTLNRFSRDYRYVMKTLAIEKKQLKERSGFGVGIRTGGTNMWQPFPNMITKMKIRETHLSRHGGTPIIYIEAPSLEGGLDQAFSPIQLDELEEDKELSAADQPPAVRLVLAIWFAIISHSELVCYFIIFLHQIRSPTLLSLPLPLMVFLWGTLTVPRPSKTFWVTIIAYTEVVVVFKCMFQFEILPWNQVAAPDNAPFFLPRIIGIERQPGMYAYYDLLLLLVVFFHRSMLKSLGLWKSSAYTGPLPVPSSSDAKSSVGGSGGDYESNGGPMGHPTDSEEARLVPKHGEMTAAGEWSHHQPNGDDPNSSPEYLASILPIKTAIYLNPFKSFFESLLKPSVRVTADVYAYMFFCDFFNFLVVIFGFASFGSQQGDGGVSQYFEENKVPVAFLVMLILQFGLIIVDRTLYLRKFILGKVIFQFILVIGIHIWMFFVLPAVTDRQFNSNLPPQMWYMVKCFYLLLSAYQIRSGYPTRILGNFLCKSYNYLNMFLFKVFMAVPFVFELRALMDWIWTDTSMTLSDWLKMEDIFAHIFQLKCQRRAETEYPQPRGQKKASLIKYIVGGGCLVGIIAVIWFPLVLFALGNTVGQPNLPYDVTVSVRIGAFQPVYSYSAQNNSIFTFNTRQWDDLGQLYKLSRVAQTFLSNYEYEDIGVVKLSSHSTSIWTISPPDNITLIEELQSNKSVTVKLEWIVSRKSTNPEQPGVATSSVEISLSSGDPSRQKLVSLLTGHASNQSVVLPNLLPKFLKITSRGTATPISQLMSHEDTPVKNPYRNLSASLNRTDESVWWELSEYCSDALYENLLKFLPYTDCDSLILYTFNDKAFPATLNIISGKGIIGLYTTFVIVIHSVIRGFFTGISFKIMFDDMPNVDRVLQLCLDIYLVRESGELDLEEDLFAKLVFLYRSPETLIKWTRPPEEEEGGGPGGQDDEGDNQAVRQ